MPFNTNVMMKKKNEPKKKDGNTESQLPKGKKELKKDAPIENIDSEDEENNYYSLGGDNHIEMSNED